ncbi:hypothetical protein Baya_14507 [Bagarius yarrelli]|uniref:Receptor-type tyrosine-protein phosphatase N2 n=1 Tax=Bagarius yarrelli TaxID=175774 RepID=A0A556V917_BAGYA|nr:hypothetical protein Baya_14507 [Bagarius yarrelli]
MSNLMDLVKTRPPPQPSASFLQPRLGFKQSDVSELRPVDQTELLDQTGLLSELQHYLQLEPKESPTSTFQKKLKSAQQSFPAKAWKVPVVSRQPPQPRIDKLLFKSGANRPTPQNSLSSVDEKFIQGVVKKLGQQSINMNALTTSDLDQLSEVITQALQVVDDAEGVKGRKVIDDKENEKKREPDAQGQLGKILGKEVTTKDIPTKASKPATEEKNKVFISELLDFLDRNSDLEATNHPQDQTSLLSSLAVQQSPSGLNSAGVEVVQSRTTQTSVDLTKKKMEPDTVDLHPAGDTEMEQWLHGEEDAGEDVQHNHVEEKKGGHVEKKLKVDVTAFSSPQHDGYFGYIVTQK